MLARSPQIPCHRTVTGLLWLLSPLSEALVTRYPSLIAATKEMKDKLQICVNIEQQKHMAANQLYVTNLSRKNHL